MAKIVEIQSIREVLNFVDEQTHVFLDLDNTILTCVAEFGSDSWEQFLVKLFKQNGMSQEDAQEKGAHLWKAVQTVSDIRFVEEETRWVIQQLKGPFFAITAREFAFRFVTEKQLEFLGVQFSDCQVPFTLNEPDHAKGVFYCANVPKWKVLQWYVQHHPGCKILLVDDLAHHIEAAAANLESFVGLRYGYLDKRKASYIPCEVTKLMGRLVSHPHATHFFKKGCDHGSSATASIF
jgi:hypothetical protein